MALAGRIGCSAPALYAHFKNKDDLLDQVRLRVQRDLRTEKRERYAVPDDDPIGLLKQGGNAYIAFARQNPALYRLVFAPAHAAAQDSIMMDDDAVMPLASGIRAAQKSGYFSAVDAEDMARLMWFALHGAILMALDHKHSTEDEAWQDAYGVIDTIGQLCQRRES